MNAALLGAIAALSWGTHDFLARFPSRGVGPVATVLVVTVTGLVFLSIWLFVVGAGVRLVWPSMWLVALTGVAYALATLSLFAALALGPISIVAPIAGSYPALAVIFALTQGARPGLVAWAAIVAVSVGVVAVAQSGGRYETAGDIAPGKLPAVLLLALGASLGFAVGLTAGQAAVPVFGEAETAWLARCFGLATVVAIWLATPKCALPIRWLPVLTLMGGLDVTALLLIVAAGNLPDPALATVASSGFGAVAVVWARIFLKESIAPIQLGGMVLVFAGVAVLAGGAAFL
jgi:drug/metabolite transporter (DMT)-like permease